MNGWLIFWLMLLSMGPIATLFLFLWEDNIDDGFEALGVAAIVLMLLAISAVGLLGTIGWLVAWGVG